MRNFEQPTLSPCPFCGGPAVAETSPQYGNHGADPQDILSVGCKTCHIFQTTSNYPGCIDQAQSAQVVARWNRRAPVGAERPYDTDAVQILVQCGEAQVLHVITCTALDQLRGPEHILGGLVYEMTKAVRQKDPT